MKIHLSKTLPAECEPAMNENGITLYLDTEGALFMTADELAYELEANRWLTTDKGGEPPPLLRITPDAKRALALLTPQDEKQGNGS